MKTHHHQLKCLGFGLLFVIGCSSGEGNLSFAPVDGVVTYAGSPMADVRVTLVPDKGPVAFAVTDVEGKFKVGGRGVVVGPVKAGVTMLNAADGGAVDAKMEAPNLAAAKSPEEMQELLKKAREMQMAQSADQAKKKASKSLIPSKYAKAESSGLNYEIKSDANHLEVSLKD